MFNRINSEEIDESIAEIASNQLDPDDLEWDTYDEDTIAIHEETEQMIREIDEITNGTYVFPSRSLD
jgi:hypothetical protein